MSAETTTGGSRQQRGAERVKLNDSTAIALERFDYALDLDQGHRMRVAGDNVLVGTRHGNDHDHPSSVALREAFYAWENRTRGKSRIVGVEGQTHEPAATEKETFAAKGEMTWATQAATNRGIPWISLERPLRDQVEAAVAEGHDRPTAFAGLVMRDHTKLFRAGEEYYPNDMGEHMSKVASRYAFVLPPGIDDPPDEFGRTFHRLYPDRPFDGAFRKTDLKFLWNKTVGPIFGVPAEDPVQRFVMTINDNRPGEAAGILNEYHDRGFASWDQFGVPHDGKIAARATAFARAPVRHLGGAAGLPAETRSPHEH